MADRKFAIEVLQNKGEVIIRCNGRSMEPIIFPKEAIYLRKVLPEQLRVGDAVFCRVNGGLQVHKISAIDGQRWQISNNRGRVNDWVGQQSIFGLAVKIEDRVLVSDDELEKRKRVIATTKPAYNPAEIEAKWQKVWSEREIFKTPKRQ